MQILTDLKHALNRLPRVWGLIITAVVVYWLLLPDFDVTVAARFVTFFTLSAAMGWAALRVFWIKRTDEVEKNAEKGQMYRAIARDIAYALVVACSVIAAATISL